MTCGLVARKVGCQSSSSMLMVEDCNLLQAEFLKHGHLLNKICGLPVTHRFFMRKSKRCCLGKGRMKKRTKWHKVWYLCRKDTTFLHNPSPPKKESDWAIYQDIGFSHVVSQTIVSFSSGFVCFFYPDWQQPSRVSVRDKSFAQPEVFLFFFFKKAEDAVDCIWDYAHKDYAVYHWALSLTDFGGFLWFWIHKALPHP